MDLHILWLIEWNLRLLHLQQICSKNSPPGCNAADTEGLWRGSGTVAICAINITRLRQI